jgi:hypothetical protein
LAFRRFERISVLSFAGRFIRASFALCGGRAGSRIPQLVAASIIREAIPHRLFGRKTFRVRLAEVIAALGTGFSVIFPSLMVHIDQSIVSERWKTFGEPIDGVLLCGSEHFKSAFLGGILTEM